MKTKSTFTGIIALMLLSIISLELNAQHIMYTYDANGNRITRQYSPARLINDTAKNDTVAKQIAAHYGLGVYPNPLMDGSSVTVSIARNKTAEETSDNAEEAIVYVLDNTGKVLLSQKQTTASPSQIDLSGYSAGIYHIKVTIGKEELFYKVMKAK